MSLVALVNQGESEEELKDGAESSVRLYAENANTLEPGNTSIWRTCKSKIGE